MTRQPILRLLLGIVSCSVSVAAGAEEANPVDQLDQAQMQEMFRVMRASALAPEQLNDEALNRAALQGLLQRLGHSAELVAKNSADTKPAPGLISELLSPEIGYLRPGTFAIEELPRLDVALDVLEKSSIKHLILDLRSPASEGDSIAAAQLLSRFLPDATPLFTLRKAGETKPRLVSSKSKGAVRCTKPLVFLMDAETSNVAEVAAAVLRQKLKPQPFLIGTATAGRAMEYKLTPFSDTHQLRLAESEAILETGSKIYQVGLKPDIEAKMDLSTKKAQFSASEKSGMKPYGYDVERPRLNEAALVGKTNPELPYQLAKSAGQSSDYDQQAPKDPVLQQALDFLTAQNFYKLGVPPEVRKAESK